MDFFYKFRGTNFEGLEELFDLNVKRPEILIAYRAFFHKIAKDFSSFIKKVKHDCDVLKNEWNINDYFTEVISKAVTDMIDNGAIFNHLQEFCNSLKVKSEELKKLSKSEVFAKYKSFTNITETTMQLKSNVSKSWKQLEEFYASASTELTKDNTKYAKKLKRGLKKDIEKYNSHIMTHENLAKDAYVELYNATDAYCGYMKQIMSEITAAAFNSLSEVSKALKSITTFSDQTNDVIFDKYHAAKWVDGPSPISYEQYEESLEQIIRMKKEQSDAIAAVESKFKKTQPASTKRKGGEIRASASFKGDSGGILGIFKKKKDDKTPTPKTSGAASDIVSSDSIAGVKELDVFKEEPEEDSKKGKLNRVKGKKKSANKEKTKKEDRAMSESNNEQEANEERAKDEAIKEDPGSCQKSKRRDSFTFSDDSDDNSEGGKSQSESDEEVPQFKLVLKRRDSKSSFQAKSVGGGLDDLSLFASGLKLGVPDNNRGKVVMDPLANTSESKKVVSLAVPEVRASDIVSKFNYAKDDNTPKEQAKKAELSSHSDQFNHLSTAKAVIDNTKLCSSVPNLNNMNIMIPVSFAVAEKFKYIKKKNVSFNIEGALVMCLDKASRKNISDTEYMNVVVKLHNFPEDVRNISFDNSCLISSKMNKEEGMHESLLNLAGCYEILTKQIAELPRTPYHNFHCMTYEVSSAMISEPISFQLRLTKEGENNINFFLSYSMNPIDTWKVYRTDPNSVPEVSNAFITLILNQLEFGSSLGITQNIGQPPVKFIEKEKSIVWAMPAYKWENPDKQYKYEFQAKLSGSDLRLNTEVQNKVSVILSIGNLVFNPLKIILDNPDNVYKIGVIKYKIRFGPYIVEL